MRTLLFVICSLAFAAGARAGAPESALATRIEGFQEEMWAITAKAGNENDWDDHSTEIEAVYRNWFSDVSFDTLTANASEPERRELFYRLLDYSVEVDRTSELRSLFNVLEEKGWANGDIKKAMHRFLLTFRFFDEAEALRQKHPEAELAAPPFLSPADLPRDDARVVLALNENGKVLEPQAIDLGSAGTVIVIGHPMCGPSNRAITAISSDPELSKDMKTAALFVTSAFTSITDGAVAEWNRTHPGYAFRYVWAESDWPEINSWGTPSFYFIKDGRLVKKVVGWPKGADEDRKEALREGLRLIAAE